MERQTVSKLIGPPPGYVGYNEGDRKGRTVDFKNTLLLMTSNVGSSVIEKGGRQMGFDPGYDEKDSSYSILRGCIIFAISFTSNLNRLDEIIVFRQLTKYDYLVQSIQVGEGGRRRPLRRAIMRLLEDSMAEKMLAGEIKRGAKETKDGREEEEIAGIGLELELWNSSMTHRLLWAQEGMGAAPTMMPMFSDSCTNSEIKVGDSVVSHGNVMFLNRWQWCPGIIASSNSSNVNP
ncbi:hypothetical protein GOBAR_DD10098 [Gossypium barbadense]|nr:hypothetical protein GOBAR_DD10098 [Gossypium barbadense]